MKMTKKAVSYILVFLMVFSSFAILPSEFWGWANVSAADVTTEESNEVETNKDEITVEATVPEKTNEVEQSTEETSKVELSTGTTKEIKNVSEETSEETMYVENDFTYSITGDNEVKILYYNGTSKDIVIPDALTDSKISALKNKKVTAIGENVFKELGLTSVSFGKNIVSIGDGAFCKNPQLKKLDLSKCSNLVTIGDNAFSENTGLKEVDLSSSTKLTTIGAYAFNGNTGLEKFSLPENTSLTTIGYGAFKNDYSLDEIDLTKCKGLTTIGAYAFYYNNLIPSRLCLDSIETIGDYAFASCAYLTDVEIGTNLKSIGYRAFYDNEVLTNVTLKGGNNAVIHNEAFLCTGGYGDDRFSVENLTIGNGVQVIGSSAFRGCSLYRVNIGDTVTTIGEKALTLVGKSQVTIGKGITTMGTNAIHGAESGYSASIKIYGEILTNITHISLPRENTTIYCHNNSPTHKTLEMNKYSDILKFFCTAVSPDNIKVNGVAVENFTVENKEYTAYVENLEYVVVKPVFENGYANCEITNKDNVYTIKILDENNNVVDTYTINVRLNPVYSVTGDVNLKLDNISSTKVGGNKALPAGTYKIKIAKDSQELGYNKTITDYCNGLTVNEKYSAYITLKATGGVYNFQFDIKTNKLVIKHDKNLPNEYLVGDLNTILKPVGDRPLSVGTQQLSEGTYKFKLSIGGKEYGYNKIVDDATTGSLSVNSKYSAQITLNATGGMYTFVLNTETNKLIIRHIPTDNEATTDVHISGTFNLVLNDKSTTGEDLTTATGTIKLARGCYTLKVYNYGVAYTAGLTVNDSGKKTLSSKYTTPVTLNATGGTYQFTFDKATGALTVSLVK